MTLNKWVITWLPWAVMFFFTTSSAQDSTLFRLTVNKADNSPFVVKLFRFENGTYSFLDSAIVTNGKYEKRVKENQLVFYKLILDNSANAFFLISGKEEVVWLAGDWESFYNGNFICFESAENQCWLKTKSAQKDMALIYRSIIQSKNKPGIQTLLQSKQIAFNELLNSIASGYGNTNCARWLIPNLVSPVISLNDQIDSFFAFHALDSLRFQDARILSFPDFFEMLKAYRQNFFAKDNSGQQLFTDLIFSRAKSNIEVKTLLLNQHLQMYLMANNIEMAMYLLKLGNELSVDTGINGQLAKKLQQLLPGNIAYEVDLPDNNGTQQKLSDLAKRKDVTLLLFYSHDCDHCLDLIPQIKQLADAVFSKTLGVFAVDVNPDTSGWKKFILENNLPFVNTTLIDSKNASISLSYAVVGIPAMVLIDRNMKIISRFPTIEMIKEKLQ